MFVISQMGKPSQRTLQSRKASALGVAANARRRLSMQTEQAPPSSGCAAFDLGSTDLLVLDTGEHTGEVLLEGQRTSEVLLEGDCLDGILAFLTAKVLCRVMRTCRALELRVGATTAWSKLGPHTGQVKLRAWEMAVLNAVGVAPQSLPRLSSCVQLVGRTQVLPLRSVQPVQ
jgi:hypothetical protein